MAQPPSDSTPAPQGPLSALLCIAISTITMVLMVAVLWLLLSLAKPGLHLTMWLALPLAAGIGLVMRTRIIDIPVAAATLAMLCMLLASAGMHLLLTVTKLASIFDMSFMQTLHRAGTGMLLHLAWSSLTVTTTTTYLLAAVLAGVIGWRGRNRT